MSENGTDGRGKPCPGGTGSKFVPRVWEHRTNRLHFTMLRIHIGHVEMTSESVQTTSCMQVVPLHSFGHFMTLFLLAKEQKCSTWVLRLV